MTDFRIIIFLFLLGLNLGAQTDSLMLKKANGKTLKKLGKNALQQNDPSSAVTFLEAYLKEGKKDAEAMDLLAEAYMKLRDYDRAQRMYLRAYSTDKEKAPEALYYHAQMMKSNGQYDSAKINFQRFKKEYKGENKLLKRQTSREIVFCDSVHQLIGGEHKIVIQHLDTAINKVHVEAAPASMDEDRIVFTSFRTEKKEYIMEDDTSGGMKRKIFLARRDTSGSWIFEGEFPGINDPAFHTGNVSFSADKKRMYFTRCRVNYLEKLVCAIYMSTREGETWSEPVRLPKPVNNPKYTSTMPAVTSDPVKGSDVIYFVSDRPNGKGGLDIWYTVYDKKNKLYKIPKNAGSKINSSQDEITPFFDNETRTLYFSSNGLGGLGGFDIFRTRGDGKKWIGTENVGLPVNTGADDIYYMIAANREEGFFVSNRKGGNALKNSTCCDDIYYYKHSEYIRIVLKGRVTEPRDSATPVADATVDIYLLDKKTKERFLIKSVRTDSLGNYQTSVEADQNYQVVVRKEDYLGTQGDVTTEGITVTRNVLKDLQLVKKPKAPIRIPNVRYQFDRSEIEEGSKIALDTTVLRLMENNPLVIVEIMAHTDNKGTDQYNLKLSQRRAESVVKYLLGRGIQPERLVAKGYGESMPVTANENPDGSDNPDGRARNRRTDFRIIGELDQELINEGAELNDQ